MTNPVETIPNLPPAIGLTGAELVWIVQAGVDKRSTVGAIAGLAASNGGAGLRGVIIASNNVPLFVGGLFSVETDLGAFSAALPALAGVTPGSYLEVQDVGYNAGANNFTVNAYGSDGIAVFGATGSSVTLTTSDVILRLTARSTYWRAVFYGF